MPPGMPRDAAHMGQTKETPRLVVFGTAGWLNDESLAGERGIERMDLFNNCVSWLRERSTIGASSIDGFAAMVAGCHELDTTGDADRLTGSCGPRRASHAAYSRQDPAADRDPRVWPSTCAVALIGEDCQAT